MSPKLHEFSVSLQRNGQQTPWGIRLVGGSDLDTPLIITRVRLWVVLCGAVFVVMLTFCNLRNLGHSYGTKLNEYFSRKSLFSLVIYYRVVRSSDYIANRYCFFGIHSGPQHLSYRATSYINIIFILSILSARTICSWQLLHFCFHLLTLSPSFKVPCTCCNVRSLYTLHTHLVSRHIPMFLLYCFIYMFYSIVNLKWMARSVVHMRCNWT